MAYFPPTGSVVSFQKDVDKLIVTVAGSVATIGTAVANQSVSGTVNLGPTSVAALQGTNPWVVQLTSGSIATSGGTTGNSSVQVVGTIPPTSVSGVGIFNVNHTGNGSIIAAARYNVTKPTIVDGDRNELQLSSRGAVVTTLFANDTSTAISAEADSVDAVAESATANNMSGVSRLTMYNNANAWDRVRGTTTLGLYTNTTGSVATVAIGNPSLITTFSQSPSIVGTYAEDAAHTTADKGLFVLAVRNETLSSITSADGDYSPIATGPLGEVISNNSPITKWISGQNSVMYGTSVQAIAPQGASIFTYITGIQLANPSANASLVKITGGLGSVLGWTIAPANGGSNIVFPNALKTGENSGVSASISGVSSVYVTMEGFIAKI